MNLWRRTRTEVAGAWRSLRYDMGERSAVRSEMESGPDVTSTGMSTFGGPVDELRTGYDEFDRPPRRLVAVSAFGILAVVGAAGSYFAVVGGLGSLLTERPAAPPPYPLAAAAPPAGSSSTAGLGPGAAPRVRERGTTAPAAVPAVPAAIAATPAVLPTPALPRPRRTAPERAATPSRPPCGCMTPPVPTPTAPSTSPSASASPSASPSDSGSPSASPSPSGHPSGDAMMRRTHRRAY